MSILWGSEISFYREDLNFTIKNNKFYIDGNYFFRNDSDEEQKVILRYPFPEKEYLGKVDSLISYNLENPDKDMTFGMDQKNGAVKLVVAANDTVIYKIAYQHELKAEIAEYILMTTHGWGKPFEQVNYNLKVADNIVVDSLAVPNSVKISEREYQWHLKSFLPFSDFIVKYHPKKQ
jgi:hypothetical protein